MNKNQLISSLKKIIQIRAAELNILEDFKKNNISSFVHFCIGQEAIAVGVAMATKKKDIFFGNHRSHGHYLAKGGDYKKMIYEIYGDQRGCCNGYGGSMHMLDQKVNFLGSSPILGSGPPIASGMAYAQLLKKKKNISVVFLGDGASEEGAFFETLNLSGLLNLPLLFVIEDNYYAGETSSRFRKTKNYNIKKIINSGFGFNFEKANGQDVEDVFTKTKILINKIKLQSSPSVLYCKTLRRSAHSGAKIDLDSQYREFDSEDIHLKKDPINYILKKLIIKKITKKKIYSIIKKSFFFENEKFRKIRSRIKIR